MTIANRKQKARRTATVSGAYGFTLVEVIIVIIILGILAALAIPQFAGTTDEAQVATLKKSLSEVRQIIQRYYHEHDGVYPGAAKEEGSGNATTTVLEARTAFRRQLTLYTDKKGKTGQDKSSTLPFGPYLYKEPVNPISGGTQIKVIFETRPITSADVGPPGDGWIYSPYTGEIRPNVIGYETY